MKKKIIIGAGVVGVLVITLGSFFVYQQYSQSKLNPKNNLGTAQKIENTTGKEKEVTVDKAGYYDVETLSADLSGDKDFLAVGAPPINDKVVGSYFKAGETLIMNGNGVIQLSPAALSSTEVSKDKYELKNGGSYYSDIQIPAGKYQVEYEGALSQVGSKYGKINGSASVTAEKIKAVPDIHSSAEQTGYVEFKPNQKKGNLTIVSNERIHFKTTDQTDFKVVLKKIG